MKKIKTHYIFKNFSNIMLILGIMLFVFNVFFADDFGFTENKIYVVLFAIFFFIFIVTGIINYLLRKIK